MMDNLTYMPPLIGGILIGLSASILILTTGKIAGISGILATILRTRNSTKDNLSWSVLFMTGMLASSYVYRLFSPVPESIISASNSTLIFAGLLVGFGTRMGSGCTSGHGVCGLSRLSIRSLVATTSFMLSGIIFCYVFLHLA